MTDETPTPEDETPRDEEQAAESAAPEAAGDVEEPTAAEPAAEADAEVEAEADAPAAARLGRLAGGRPGVAIAYARAPEAATIRGELARELLDLVDARASARLAAARALVARASDLVAILDRGAPAGNDAEPAPEASPDASQEAAPESAADGGTKRAPASERRRGAAMLL